MRNYDTELKDNEGRRYFYGFDYDVMHPYMIRSFRPFIRGKNLLELGSHYGNLTKLLLNECADVTCVEASGGLLPRRGSYWVTRLRFTIQPSKRSSYKKDMTTL